MRGSTITLEDYPLEDAVRIFRSAGFDSLEVWKHQLRRCKTHELRQRFAAWAKGCGIAMGGFNAVGEDYFRPFGTDAELEGTLEGLKADTQITLALGSRDLLIWEGRAPDGTTESDWIGRLLPRLTEVLRAAITYASSLGIRILTEPHPFTVGMSDRFLAKLCDAFDPQWFGVTYDLCHYGVGRPTDYIEAVRALGHRIRHIHFLRYRPENIRTSLSARERAPQHLRHSATHSRKFVTTARLLSTFTAIRCRLRSWSVAPPACGKRRSTWGSPED